MRRAELVMNTVRPHKMCYGRREATFWLGVQGRLSGGKTKPDLTANRVGISQMNTEGLQVVYLRARTEAAADSMGSGNDPRFWPVEPRVAVYHF